MRTELSDFYKGRYFGLHWFHWLVISLSFCLTLFAWRITVKHIEDSQFERFDKSAHQIIELIRERMEKYENTLHSGTALIHSLNDNVKRDHWKKFAEKLDLPARYPGASGIGMNTRVQAKDLNQFITSRRNEYANFSLHPKSQREEYWIVTHIEPLESNNEALGLDAIFNEARLMTIQKAAELGVPQLSSPVVLVQDKENSPGVILYQAYYRGNICNTPEERKENVLGMVYVPIVVKNLISGPLLKDNRYLDFNISDDEQNIYTEIDPENPEYDPDPYYKQNYKIDLYGRSWVMHAQTNKNFHENIGRYDGMIILAAGIIINFVVIYLFIIMSQRARKSYELAETLCKETEIKRSAAEYASKMASLGQMTAGIAHEVNNPLSVISGYVGQLKQLSDKDILSKEQTTLITKKIDDTCRRISKIVQALRSYSRNVTDSPKEDVAVQQILDDTLAFCVDRFQKGGVDLSYPKNCKLVAHCRPVEISQVLLNLLGNAYDAVVTLPVRWVEIIVTEDDENQYISVLDSGPGIPKEKAGKIMEAFYTTKEIGKGTGLGLSVSLDIMQSHGGDLRIDFNHKHTKFDIVLPKKLG